MCLIGLAIGAHPRFALVVAANRDEFHERPAAGLDWWQPRPDAPWLLGGRDLSAGGTWMGLSSHGRLAMLTNVRDPARHRADAPSRGALVPAWLDSQDPAEAVWPALAALGCNPFNLIAGDLRHDRWWWADDGAAAPRPLAPGVHGLSNASLGTPWPKVRRLEQGIVSLLADAADESELVPGLFAVLADRSPAEDAALPDTGVGLTRERMLAPAFITSSDGHYGTRCSTVLLGERTGSGWRLRLAERSFDATGRATHERSVTLDAWPHAGTPPAVGVVTLS